MDRLEQKLDSVFAAYRDAIPDPEASADFMPRLWVRIEAKRSFLGRLRRMSRVAAAAALAAGLLGGALIFPRVWRDAPLSGTYVDVLAETHADETLAVTGGVRLDLLDSDQR